MPETARDRFRLLRAVATVLGSGLFFLASCAGGTAAGTHLLSVLDARDIAAGDPPHDFFHVLAYAPDAEPPIEVIDLRGIATTHESAGPRTFLLPSASGAIALAEFLRVRYAAVSESPGSQRVEVTHSDDDVDRVSVYLARDRSIVPLSSRRLHPGQMFEAMTYALALSFGLWLVGKAILGSLRRGARA